MTDGPEPQMEAIGLPRGGRIPNNAAPVRLYRSALGGSAPSAEAFEELFGAHGWTRSWRNGIYPFHHFHSTAHEVLGIAAGSVEVQIGGVDGPVVTLRAGDAVLLPAGTGHKRVSHGPGLLVVGAYAEGRDCDLIDAGDVEAGDPSIINRIAAVPPPRRDPVLGGAMDDWPGA